MMYLGAMSKPSRRGIALEMLLRGNANDTSGNNNHGTVTGATLTTDNNGRANRAYAFDGSSSISCNAIQTMIRGNTFSLSITYSLNATSYANYFLNTNADGYYTAIRHATTTRFVVYNSSGVKGTTSDTFTKTYTNRVFILKSDDTMRRYANGNLLNIYSAAAAITPLAGMYIGNHSLSGAGGLNGTIYDIAINMLELTQSEIIKQYNYKRSH